MTEFALGRANDLEMKFLGDVRCGRDWKRADELHSLLGCAHAGPSARVALLKVKDLRAECNQTDF
jgi:hypothetical protein